MQPTKVKMLETVGTLEDFDIIKVKVINGAPAWNLTKFSRLQGEYNNNILQAHSSIILYLLPNSDVA